MGKQIVAIVAISGLSLAATACAAPAVGNASYASETYASKAMLSSAADRSGSIPPSTGALSNATKPPSDAAGSFPRSFLIPGTDTSIRIGG